jgi:hypothetical protein
LLIAIVSCRRQAEAIMHRLESENFADERISVVFPDRGALELPGLGAFIAAGPIIAALGASTGESAVGLAGGLIGLGIPASKAECCQQRLTEGKFLLSVHVVSDAESDRARRIFSEMGAEDICSPAEGSLHAA